MARSGSWRAWLWGSSLVDQIRFIGRPEDAYKRILRSKCKSSISLLLLIFFCAWEHSQSLACAIRKAPGGVWGTQRASIINMFVCILFTSSTSFLYTFSCVIKLVRRFFRLQKAFKKENTSGQVPLVHGSWRTNLGGWKLSKSNVSSSLHSYF